MKSNINSRLLSFLAMITIGMLLISGCTPTPNVEDLKDKQDVWGLINMLYSDSEALEALIDIGEPAVEPLIEAIISHKWTGDVLIYISEALGEIGDSRAVESLIEVLKDEDINYGDSNVQESAAAALVKIGEPAVEPLIEVLKDEYEYEYVQESAAAALVKIGEPAVETLIEAFKDEDRVFQLEVIETLLEIGEPAVEPLIKALNNEDSNVRCGAAEALGEIGDSRAIEPLIEALNDENENVRKTVVIILNYSFDQYMSTKFEDLLQIAVPLCDAAFREPITSGSARAPVFYLIKEDYRENSWEIKWFKDYIAGQNSEIKTLVAICESRHEMGQYTSSEGYTGYKGYQLIWSVRLIAWPDGDVLNENTFTGTYPPDLTNLLGDAYGDPPDDALLDWLSEVLVE